MKLITWNVQWCRGVDGKVDPARIVKHAKALADFDVLCLQEVANNFPDPRLAGSHGENQFAEVARVAARLFCPCPELRSMYRPRPIAQRRARGISAT